MKRRYQFPDGSTYPVVEMTKQGMFLMVSPEDVACATPHDPTACALAQCAIRMGAQKAFIAGTVAYIITSYRGRLSALRFDVPPATRKAIKLFDKTGELPAGGFVLNPLRHSRRSAVKKVYNDSRTPDQRRWTGKRGGSNQLRTYRYLTGHVHTARDES